MAPLLAGSSHGSDHERNADRSLRRVPLAMQYVRRLAGRTASGADRRFRRAVRPLPRPRLYMGSAGARRSRAAILRHLHVSRACAVSGPAMLGERGGFRRTSPAAAVDGDGMVGGPAGWLVLLVARPAADDRRFQAHHV